MKKWGSFCLYLSMFLVATIGHTHDTAKGPVVVSFGDIFFDLEGYNLRESSQKIIETNAQIVNALQSATILIQGYADSRGSTEYNAILAERRAKAVLRYFIANNVDEDRIKIVSYGEEKPQCLEDTEDCWQLNRRIHIIVTEEARDEQ